MMRARKEDIPTLPLIFFGAISARYKGATQSPMPDAIPVSHLHAIHHQQARPANSNSRPYLPRPICVILPLVPMSAAPTVITPALTLLAPFLPYLSMTKFAMRLPMSPPMVKLAVMAENVKSDMGIHVGRPSPLAGGSLGVVVVSLQVRTAWI